MSFRYTNGLIGMLKHRLQLESAHRDIARRTFTGTCNGIEVTCTGHGSVVGIRMIDAAKWEPYYRKQQSLSNNNNANNEGAGLDLASLAQSIRGATWEATRRIRQEKEEAHHRSLSHNPQLLARGNLRDWYEQDANSIQPRRMDGLKQEMATPWMQAVRYGKSNPDQYIGKQYDMRSEPVGVLSQEDCTPTAIPIASANPLYTAGLLHVELDLNQASNNNNNNSRVDERRVLSEQRKEMNRDEQLFWERVELIRRGQLATIPGGVKRTYADMSSTVVDNVEDKVELRFAE